MPTAAAQHTAQAADKQVCYGMCMLQPMHMVIPLGRKTLGPAWAFCQGSHAWSMLGHPSCAALGYVYCSWQVARVSCMHAAGSRLYLVAAKPPRLPPWLTNSYGRDDAHWPQQAAHNARPAGAASSGQYRAHTLTAQATDSPCQRKTHDLCNEHPCCHSQGHVMCS